MASRGRRIRKIPLATPEQSLQHGAHIGLIVEETPLTVNNEIEQVKEKKGKGKSIISINKIDSKRTPDVP